MSFDTTDEILTQLTQNYEELSPQLRRAADFVLNNPNEVGVNSMRQLALAAEIKPNTLVRMAKALGFESYQDFRKPFQDLLRRGVESFPDRARWLQSLGRGEDEGQLFGQMAATSLMNIEQLFAGTSTRELRTTADLILNARTSYILGVGVCYSLARAFWYVGRMAVDNLVHVPRQGNLPIDDITRIGRKDLLLAMTFQPYRNEVVEAVALARRRGATIVAMTDSRTSPIAIGADQVFVVPSSTPQFFPSAAPAMILMEALLAFMVAGSGRQAIANIEAFHRVREEAGIYWHENGGEVSRAG
ncbi:MAG: MurR/RpiR family transcriptional regulator [Kiloniellales bacterium]|nr:MurR/RpiR family transcriptional regulator [Kiloniellales bacterium]